MKTKIDDLIDKIYDDRDNIKLRVEELKCIKDHFSDYDYLFILVKLKLAIENLTDAIDIMNGWYPEDEEDIPSDMIFKGEEDE